MQARRQPYRGLSQTIDKLIKATKEDLIEINDIGPVAAKFIYEYFSKESSSRLVSSLLSSGIQLASPEKKFDSNFAQKTIVLTGSFNSASRNQFKEQLQKRGAKVTSSISTKTDLLIVGNDPGSKLAKARELKIEVLTEQEIIDLMN